MLKIKHLLLLSSLLFMTIHELYSQNDEVPNATHPHELILPKSPEAAAIERYGQYNVSGFTGKPNISIPIHTVSSGELSIPISINYDASGIKVDQEATQVGLGWNLIAGATITYQPIGGDERNSQQHPYHINPIGIQNLSDYLIEESPHLGPPKLNTYSRPLVNLGLIYLSKPWSENPINYPSHEPFDDKNNLILGARNHFYGEADVYRVDLLGQSFKFTFDPNPISTNPNKHQPVIVGENNHSYKINVFIEGRYLAFEIISEDGVTYIFKSENTEKVNSSIFGNNSHDQVINTWFLSEMKDQFGNYIKLSYSDHGKYYPIPTYSESLEARNKLLAGGGVSDSYRFNRQENLINSIFLTEIETKDEILSFVYQDDRSDVQGEGLRRLSEIKLFDRHTGFNHGNIEILKWKFHNEEYFETTGSKFIGGNYLKDGYIEWYKGSSFNHPGFEENHLSKRLKLTSIEKIYNRVDQSSSSYKSEFYKFSYNEENELPLKTSFAKDFWGYYNGEENRIPYDRSVRNKVYNSFLPNIKFMSLIDPLNDIIIPSIESKGFEYRKAAISMRNCKANRYSNPELIDTWMLQSIQYPTGGKTYFDFEIAEIDNRNYVSSEIFNRFVKSAEPDEYVLDYYTNDHVMSSLNLPSEMIFEVDANVTNVDIDIYIGLNDSNLNGNDLFGAKVNIKGIDDTNDYFEKNYNYHSSGENQQKFKEDIYLVPGRYLVTYEVPDDLISSYSPLIHIGITLNKEAEDQVNYDIISNAKKVGGGVRIASITNYARDSREPVITNYDYENGYIFQPISNYKSEFSYYTINGPVEEGGVALLIPHIVYYTPFPVYSESRGTSSYNEHTVKLFRTTKETLSSNSLIQPTAYHNSGIVGYENVTITKGEDEGREFLTYGIPDCYKDDEFLDNYYYYSFGYHLPYDFFTIKTSDRNRVYHQPLQFGDILSKKVYNSNNVLKYEELYFYDFTSFDYHDFRNVGLVDVSRDVSNGGFFIKPLYGLSYPSYSFRKNLYRKENKLYDEGNEPHLTLEEYNYHPQNFNITSKIQIDQRGNRVQEYKYPHDFSGEPFETMIEKNMISNVIEAIDKVDETILNIVQKEFEVKDDQVLLKKINTQKGEGPMELEVTYDKYDEYGNLLQYHTKDDMYTSIVWGYNKRYPVAKFENVVYSQVENFIAEIENLTDNDNDDTCLRGSACQELKIREYFNSLRESEGFQEANITSFTYDPFVGITSQADPNGKLIFYEYNDQNELISIKDNDGHVISGYSYKKVNLEE